MSQSGIGLDANARQSVAEALKALLADTYVLYMKTHVFHWNVVGPHFPTLHTMFEAQYRELWAALDEIAERIRALGAFAPASGKALGELAAVSSAEAAPPPAMDMVRTLLKDHETLIRRARAALETAAGAGDAASEDLITVRLRTHEKTAWMLRAITE